MSFSTRYRGGDYYNTAHKTRIQVKELDQGEKIYLFSFNDNQTFHIPTLVVHLVKSHGYILVTISHTRQVILDSMTIR